MKLSLQLQLVFPGTCEEAFNVYKEALGGEIVFVFRKREDESISVREEDKEKISHILLKTAHFQIGGEDADSGVAVTGGNNAKQVLVFYDLNEIHRTFNLLSEGGQVVAPLEKTHFSEAFGEVVDRFGIRWLIMMRDDSHPA